MATRTHVLSNRGQTKFSSLPSKNVINRTHVLLGGTNTDLQLLLREWDNGRKEVRLRILRRFVATNRHKTGRPPAKTLPPETCVAKRFCRRPCRAAPL